MHFSLQVPQRAKVTDKPTARHVVPLVDMCVCVCACARASAGEEQLHLADHRRAEPAEGAARAAAQEEEDPQHHHHRAQRPADGQHARTGNGENPDPPPTARSPDTDTSAVFQYPYFHEYT